MTILNQDASLKREKAPAWLEQKISDDTRIDVLQFPLDLVQLCEKERLSLSLSPSPLYWIINLVVSPYFKDMM